MMSKNEASRHQWGTDTQGAILQGQVDVISVVEAPTAALTGTASRRLNALPDERLEKVEGWGRAVSGLSYVYRPTEAAGILEAFEIARQTGRSVGLRGAGRSYGDASLNAENLVLDLSRMNRILAWDPQGGVITVEPGVTVQQLWQYVIEDGWWPAVVPGTMYATLGGCAAMNIHGKNNWRVGPIGDHITEFRAVLPGGEQVTCSRAQRPELFHAFIGGFGMLGCFTAITLQLKRIYSGLLSVEAIPTPDLAAMFAGFEERLDRADYLVGWLDGMARGSALGRGQLHRADYLAPDADPFPAQTLRVSCQQLPETFFGVLPRSSLWRLMQPLTNDPGIRLINAARYHGRRLGGRKGYFQSHAAFAFLLDYVPDWKLAYGPGGLIQYQAFIPAPAAPDTFERILRSSQRSGLPPYLAVFKRHRPDAFLISHAVEGYSLALDYRVTAENRPALARLTAGLDRLVLEAGGRFYFAKDGTLSPASVAAFLGQDTLNRFCALKRRCDPENLLQTNLSRRLFDF